MRACVRACVHTTLLHSGVFRYRPGHVIRRPRSTHHHSGSGMDKGRRLEPVGRGTRGVTGTALVLLLLVVVVVMDSAHSDLLVNTIIAMVVIHLQFTMYTTCTYLMSPNFPNIMRFVEILHENNCKTASFPKNPTDSKFPTIKHNINFLGLNPFLTAIIQK